MKSKVDEKNLDEEIGKIKEKLAAKVAERVANNANNNRPINADDDFFNSVPDRVVPQSSNGVRRKPGDDAMDIDFDGTTSRTTGKKRVVHEVSQDDDDDFMDVPPTKKPRTTANTAKKPSVSRSRGSSEPFNPPLPPVRKAAARTAASRAKKVCSPPSCLALKYLTVDDCGK